MEEDHRKALLIGAGFPKTIGMPLVWDLTKELYQLLKRVDWRKHPTLSKNYIVPHIYDLIKKPNLHYEDFISALDVAQGRFENRSHIQDIAGVKSKVIELVYLILLQKQNQGLKNFNNKKFIEGFKKFVSSSSPLWVFSLNHDNFIEYLCLNNGIDIKNAFKGPTTQLKVNSENLNFETITPEKIKGADFSRFVPFQDGLNLMKLHGGLEQFGIHDLKEIISIPVTNNTWDDFNKSLNTINKIPTQDEAINNELMAYDQSGELQFLRRTHLAGSHKFDKRYPHVADACWINRFGADINYANELIVIGYSFGDFHINSIIEKWIGHSSKRKILIVAPDIKEIPKGFGHFCFQIELIKMTAEKFFLQFR